MDFPSRLVDQLDALSAALGDSGDDLHAILSVLTDDLNAAVPSFVGLSVTVHADGDPISLHTADSRPAATSMLLPLTPQSDPGGGSYLIFYAHQPGAFTELAAAFTNAGIDGGVILDRHLPPPHADGADTLARRSDIDQAIGVLIEAGHPPDLARQELHARAASAGVTAHHVALEILHHLDETPEAGGPAEI